MKTWLRHQVAPLGFLFLLVLTFGIFIPWLGFYWDDWPVLLTGRLQGAPGFWQFYQYDRPVSAWTYVVTHPILGENPVAWHLFTLLLRWLTTFFMWKTTTTLWPCHRPEATWSAFLFAVYPVFTQQAISVAYSQHWLCFLLFFVSLYLMVLAWRTPGRFWLLTIISCAASLLGMFTMEYFVGLELLLQPYSGCWHLSSQTNVEIK